MDLCDNYGIPSKSRYNNSKEESMIGTMIQIIIMNFYIIGKSSDPYTQ